MEADGALGVAGRVQDVGGVAGQADALPLGKAFIGRSGFRRGDAEPGGLHFHHVEQCEIVLVKQDGCAGEPLEAECAADMVDVGVGYENLLELEAERGEAAVNACDLVARIDDDGLAGLLVSEDGAIALERADGEGFEDHALIVGPEGNAKGGRDGPAFRDS